MLAQALTIETIIVQALWCTLNYEQAYEYCSSENASSPSTWLAQFGEHQSAAEWEVAGSNPSQTNTYGPK